MPYFRTKKKASSSSSPRVWLISHSPLFTNQSRLQAPPASSSKRSTCAWKRKMAGSVAICCHSKLRGKWSSNTQRYLFTKKQHQCETRSNPKCSQEQEKNNYTPQKLNSQIPQNGHNSKKLSHQKFQGPSFWYIHSSNFGRITSTRKFRPKFPHGIFPQPWGRPVGHGSCDWSGVASPQPQGRNWLHGRPANAAREHPHVLMAKWKS